MGGHDDTANAGRLERVLVVGAGAMGAQIAMLAALAGLDVTLQDVDDTALPAADAELRGRMARSVERGRLDAAAVDEAFGRLAMTTSLEAGARDADLVLEAATERLEVKRTIFAALDAAAPPHAVLATNSSSYGSSLVAEATDRPDRVCNVHFFNPPLVMRAVEVVRGPHTSDATVATALAFVARLDRRAVLLQREVPGFVANRLMAAVRDEALRLYADGIAGFEDIDIAARDALGHPMGPFELMDLVGLDVSYLARMAAYEQTGDAADLPHPEVVARYERGELGRKTGKGWYSHDS